ncbi:hypothetical protein [Methylobacterium sp.]|uniref:hypothetical protein n=1 Tax=Methylobacterium sp. TaxID=409 RepID=UPI003B02DF55
MSYSSLALSIAQLDAVIRDCVITVSRAPSPTFTLARIEYSAVPKKARVMTIPDGARLILSLAKEIQDAQRHRMLMWDRQTGNRAPFASDRAALAGYHATPMDRRTETRSESSVLKAAKRAMRHGGSGGSTWKVEFGGDALVGYEETPRRFTEWKRGNPYSRVADDHVIHIPTRWWLRVARIGDGSGVVGGRLVLDARRIFRTADGDRAIYSATIARPGRGYTAVVEQAFISCWSDVANIRNSFRDAANERVPDAIRQRDIAAKEIARLEALDEAALANLVF